MTNITKETIATTAFNLVSKYSAYDGHWELMNSLAEIKGINSLAKFMVEISEACISRHGSYEGVADFFIESTLDKTERNGAIKLRDALFPKIAKAA